mgnify:FL=1
MELERYSIDVRSAMDDLYIGPQAQVLEQIARFNEEWVRNNDDALAITPKFRWKPGTYDKVKNILSQTWLQWHKRPSGMDSLFSRERAYSKNRIKEALLQLDRALYQFRSQGQQFITDVDEIEGHFNLFKTMLCIQLEQLQKVFPESVVDVIEAENFADTVISTKISIPELKINVSVGSRSSDNRDLGLIDFGGLTIELNFPLSVWFNNLYSSLDVENNTLRNRINLPKNLLTTHNNRYYGHGNQTRLRGFQVKGSYHGNAVAVDHPYISRNGYGTGNVCMGELMTEILQSYLKLDWNTFGYWLDVWLTSYKVGVTGPLNNISYAKIGKTKVFNSRGEETTDEYYDGVGHSSGTSCFNKVYNWLERRHDDDLNYRVVENCDNIECLLRDSCTPYINHTIGLQKREDFSVFMDNHKIQTLLPNQQEEDRAGHRFIDLISDITYSTGTFGDIRTPHGLMESAFVNKQGELAIKILRYCIAEEITAISEDDDYNIDLIRAFSNCETHEDVVAVVNEQYTNLESPRTERSDEQDEMLAWAHAMQQQR